MSDREARDLADVRRELRERLMHLDWVGAVDALATLRDAAGADLDLRAEYERWAFRFELLAAERRAQLHGSGQPATSQVLISIE